MIQLVDALANELIILARHGFLQCGASRVDPDKLNDFERRILKEAFLQARRLQSRLALDYQI